MFGKTVIRSGISSIYGDVGRTFRGCSSLGRGTRVCNGRYFRTTSILTSGVLGGIR